jgi:hypothetical protein
VDVVAWASFVASLPFGTQAFCKVGTVYTSRTLFCVSVMSKACLLSDLLTVSGNGHNKGDYQFGWL